MKLGDKIKVNNKLLRRITTKQRGGRSGQFCYKYWKRYDQKSNVIFLGWRYLSDGFRCWEGEEGWSFDSDNRFRAALVCESENLNPYYAIID